MRTLAYTKTAIPARYLRQLRAQTIILLFPVPGAAGVESVKFLAGFKANRFAGGDADFSAGAGIAANAGFARADAEDAESPQLDSLARAESLFQSLEDRVNSGLRLGSGQTSALDHVMDDVLLDQRGTSLDDFADSTSSYASDITGFAPEGEWRKFQ